MQPTLSQKQRTDGKRSTSPRLFRSEGTLSGLEEHSREKQHNQRRKLETTGMVTLPYVEGVTEKELDL